MNTTRREFLYTAGMLTLSASAPRAAAGSQRYWLYVGTYTYKKSKGIYLYEWNSDGRLQARGLAAESVNPSFLAIPPSRQYLYAVGEVPNLDGKRTGGVRAFALEPETGKLAFLNQQPSAGAGPCHVVVDQAGRHVLVANYSGGTVAVLPLDQKGRLREPSCVVQHQGKSVNPKRQEAPHPHSVNLDPTGRFAVVADLGLDRVFVYRYDAVRGELKPNEPAFASVAPGSGPRHFTFHPSGRFAYVINELANTVTAFSWDGTRGTLREIQTIDTLPKDFSGTSYTAEILVHPSGEWLFGSNRGHDSLSVFRIDMQTGKLTLVGLAREGIRWPRNFAIAPDGRFVLVASERGDNIVIFELNPKTGELTRVAIEENVPTPVCLKFVSASA